MWSQRNRLLPGEAAAGSDKKVIWVCEKGHEWEARISAVALDGCGCPYCAGKRAIPGETDLQTLRSIRGASELAFMNGLDMYLIRGEDNNFKITTGADLDRFRGILGMDMLHAAVRVIFED
jgi:hypothetical protein